ncbi:MAG: hypothetical protein IT337_18180 [Thermomicrobiales bacterium]|nr:hypothetical protein [Thermomicrobiales bacterium]
MPKWNGRRLGWTLALLAAMTLSPLAALAQDASPVASAAIVSPTRAEWTAAYEAEMAFTEPSTPGGTFIDSATYDIQTVQPLLAEENNSIAVAGMMFEPLVGGDPRTGEPAPNALADFWEIAPDRITYTFHLNRDARWHDGEPVTAADVIFSFDALANEKTGSVYTGTFNESVASYRAIDDYTVEVVAKQPRVDFLYTNMMAAVVVPKHIWGDIPVEKWATDPGATGQDPSRVVGSGPFKFQEWTPGESVTLVRNDDYYGKVAWIDTYVRRVWPDQIAVVNALLNDELDVAGLEPADVAAIEGTPGIAIEDFPTRNFSYLEFNLDPEVTTLFQDRDVRQAMMYAIDRQSIVDDILLGYAEVARGTQPVISYAYAPEDTTPVYEFDPEKAKQLLAAAGWTDSNGDGTVDKDGQELSFELLYPSGSPTSDQIAAYLQDAWKAVGVDAAPKSLEFPAMIEATTTDPSFAVALYGFQWDATFIQDAMFGCNQYQVGFNDMRYCNPDLDKINAQAVVAFDEAQRRALLIQASNIVNEDLPVLVLDFGKSIVAYSDRVQNYAPNTWGGTPLTYLWLEQ